MTNIWVLNKSLVTGTALSANRVIIYNISGPDSSIGTATDYGAGRSGIESRCGRGFPTVQTGPGAHPAYTKMGTGSFPGVKIGRGVLLTTHLAAASCHNTLFI